MNATGNQTPKRVKYDKQRRFLNLLLEPYVQVPIGVFSTVLSFGFVLSIGGVLYWKFHELYSLLLLLSDADLEIASMTMELMYEVKWWFFGISSLFLGLHILLGIIYTHRLIGPSYAIKQHIIRLLQNDYSKKIHLRKKDSLQDLSKLLNDLTDHLKNR